MERNGTIYCDEHAAAAAVSEPAAPVAGTYTAGSQASSIPPPPPNSNPNPVNAYVSPYTAPYGVPPPSGPYVPASASGISPILAFILGLIPGVGAIYNGQYAKGLVHAVVFGLLVSLLSSGRLHEWEPLFGILLSLWVFYMAFEAFHTARKRRAGEPVEELSSLMQGSGMGGRVPVGPIVLIGLGVLFLMDTLHLLNFDEVIRYWPVGLIIGGAYMLYARLEGRRLAVSPSRDDDRGPR